MGSTPRATSPQVVTRPRRPIHPAAEPDSWPRSARSEMPASIPRSSLWSDPNQTRYPARSSTHRSSHPPIPLSLFHSRLEMLVHHSLDQHAATVWKATAWPHSDKLDQPPPQCPADPSLPLTIELNLPHSRRSTSTKPSSNCRR